MMNGELSGSDPANGLAANADVIYDLTTGNADGSGRTPFTGNVIPASRISPVAQKLMTLLQKARAGFYRAPVRLRRVRIILQPLTSPSITLPRTKRSTGM